jgi:ATP-dependent helicase/nuclease subunit B
MPVVRHFLGWERPLVEAVRDFIIPGPPSGPIDLSSDLILVPTRQAGRRLTDALALYCAEANTALLSCQVVTPSVLLKATPPRPIAGPLDVQACWITVLSSIDPAQLPGLFPSAPPDTDAEWALRFASMIDGLRHTLLEAGLTIETLVSTRADDLVELERWQDLAALETAYLAELDRLGLLDPCHQQLAVTEGPELDENVSRIIVAAVPDPNEPARRVLEHLAGAVQIDILIAAPDSLAETFDAWGRPLVEAWNNRSIDIPEPDTHITLAASPADQAAEAVNLLQTQSATDGARAALGTPDRGLVPHLQAAIQQRGGTAFDPADKPLREHALYHLVAAWLNLATDRSYAALARLLRQPDLMMHLDHDEPGRSATVLKQLDGLQNERLPWDLAAVNHWLRAKDAPQALKDALTLISSQLPKQGDSLSASLRAFLQAILEHRTITAGRPEDDEFERAARTVDEAIHELAETESRTSLPLRSTAMLLMRRLGEAHYHRERDPEAIDLDGWLELAWNPAPQLIIAGFCEGAIPTTPSPDAFLTDSLRVTLGMRSDADILARDAFLLQGIIESRRKGGDTWLLVGKVSDTGDPLRPSRLLFRCSDNELPGRAAHLFRDVASPRSRPAATTCLQLDPGCTGVTTPPSAVSVTAFRDYLACPFRFYLARVLRMEEQDDSKRAPDALDFGNLIHSALQRMGESVEMRACTDARQIAEFLTSQAQRWIERQYGSAPALPIRMALHAAQQRLEAAAQVQAGLAAEGWEITEVEQPFMREIGGLLVKGKIDRIDRHRDTGALRVIDYKTTDTASDPIKAHLAGVRDSTPDYAQVTAGGKEKRWIDLQLPLYAILGFDQAVTPPEPAYFVLPRAVSETDLKPWPTFDADLAAAALDAAEAIATNIRESIFWPPSERVDYDDFEALFHDGLEGWQKIGSQRSEAGDRRDRE